MFPIVFKLNKGNSYRLLSVGTIVFAVIFLVVVGIVVYRGLSEAFLQSEKTMATSSVPDIKNEDIIKAVNLVNKWKEKQVLVDAPVLNRSQISVKVLNGMDLDGLSVAVVDKLKLAGFENTSQTPQFLGTNQEITSIESKQSSNLYIDLVIDSLGLTREGVIIEDLPEDAESDMVVIAGQDLSGLLLTGGGE